MIMREARFYSQDPRRATFDYFAALLGDVCSRASKSIDVSYVFDELLRLEDLCILLGVVLNYLEFDLSPVADNVEPFRVFLHFSLLCLIAFPPSPSLRHPT